MDHNSLPAASTPVRILCASDQPLVQTGILSALTVVTALCLVGLIDDGLGLEARLQKLDPAVLLLDLHLTASPPLEILAKLAVGQFTIKTIGLANRDCAIPLAALLEQGLAGYVLKTEPPHLLVEAIRAVAGGGTWFSQPVVEQLLREQRTASLLNERECQILRLMARGLNNPEIAAELGLGRQTVRNYVSRIYEKLGVSSRVEAALWAKEHRIA